MILQQKVCSFFGHRKVNVTKELEEKLKKVIEDLIINYNVKVFLFGSHSNFDYLCHFIVTELKVKFPNIRRIVYTCKSEACILESERQKWEEIFTQFEKKEIRLLGFDEEYEHKTKYISGRAGYVERNQAMINNSDYCVFYYDESYQPERRKLYKRSLSYYQPKSGTRLAFNYVKQKKKVIINILDEK